MSSSKEYLEYITDGLPEPEMLSYIIAEKSLAAFMTTAC